MADTYKFRRRATAIRSQVLAMLAAGKTVPEICANLGCGEGVVYAIKRQHEAANPPVARKPLPPLPPKRRETPDERRSRCQAAGAKSAVTIRKRKAVLNEIERRRAHVNRILEAWRQA